MYKEEEFLMLSGLQHYAYCPRQWGLIHIEQQWKENERTADGRIFHKVAHDAQRIEKRGDIRITRGLYVSSEVLGAAGICDVVEFHKSDEGISLYNYDGIWQPYPVEYKKGRPKEFDADELQLCGQAMCLEEMLLCTIPKGSLFYGETRRRKEVEFTEGLRGRVKKMILEMHDYGKRGYTPKVKWKTSCNACSLKEICVPRLGKIKSVEDYIEESMKDG